MPPENINPIEQNVNQISPKLKIKWWMVIAGAVLIIVITGGAFYFINKTKNVSTENIGDNIDCVIDTENLDKLGTFPVSYSTREKFKSPLFQAVMNGDTIESINLLNNGADANEKIEADGGYYTPLMVAVSIGATQITKCLLDKGADPSVTNHQGRNALIFAAVNCRADVVDILLSGGADPSVQVPDGRDALMFSSYCAVSSNESSYNIIRNLLSHGAKVNVISKSLNLADPNGPGISALGSLASIGNNENIIAELMKAGAKDSDDGLYMKPSKYAVSGNDKISYDVLVGATSSDILSINNKLPSSLVWSEKLDGRQEYSKAEAYCKGLTGYRLPTKTELLVAFINNEPGFSPDRYFTSDSGDGMYWSASYIIDQKKDVWEKKPFTAELKEYYLKSGWSTHGVVNMYNGIYYTALDKSSVRCVKVD
jgi:hypothetical protein